MAKLDSESEEEFLTRIKNEFAEQKEDLILIEDGMMFIGSWGQLADCFGIYPDQLNAFCEEQDADYQIINYSDQ